MAIDKELLDQLLAGRDPQDVFARDGLFDDLKKALSERILNAELDEHLEGDRADAKLNRRNGSSRKTMLTGTSKIDLAILRNAPTSPIGWLSKKKLWPHGRKSRRTSEPLEYIR